MVNYQTFKSGKPKIRLSALQHFSNTETEIKSRSIHTICESGLCPNKRECWARGTATFMILGDICTRACKFCGVTTGRPLPTDPAEPEKIAHAIKKLQLKHAVITSVDRDDLPDYGAHVWIETIAKIRECNPSVTIETLIPDFNGNKQLLDLFTKHPPEIVSHNLETVKSLTPKVRSVATYKTSLAVLQYLSSKGVQTKSGIMLGLGETTDEIIETIIDIRNAGCSILTIGQYYQPSKKHYPIKEFISDDTFIKLKTLAFTQGFKHVESGALVRSSYHAEMQL